MTQNKQKDISFSVKRSDRKTLSIYVERDGSISVHAPNKAGIDQINDIVKRKSNWIRRQLSELEKLDKSRVKRELVDGEGYLYLGRSYRLKIENGLKSPLVLYQGYFVLDENHLEDAKTHFVSFYKEKGRRHLEERVEHFKGKLGVNPRSIKVMELRSRWASQRNGNLNFHWKVVLAPVSIIDYVIVHELAHFIEPNHTSEFWRIVESVLPDYSTRREWLRLNGAGLDI